MVRYCAFLTFLVVMSYWSTCSLGCDRLQIHNLRNNSALTHLEQMERLVNVSCLKDRKDFALPLEKVDSQQLQKTQVIKYLGELIHQLLNLFTSNESFAAWETTILDKFCNNLNQQLSDLQDCLKRQQEMKEPTPREKDPINVVRRYFERITVYLMEKKYSPCAWEVVRAEVWRALSSSASLVARLSKEKE